MSARVLIVRFSSIGDIVLTTPVVRCVKQQLEGDMEVHYLTKEMYAPILQANPYINKVHTIRENVSEIVPALRDTGFDYVIDLHCNIRSAQVKRALKALAFTVNKINWEKWLMVNFKINKLPPVHIVDRYLAAAKHLGVVNDGKGLDYFIPPEEEVELSTLPEVFRQGYVAFAIGARHETKKLPVQKIISVCKNMGKPLVLLGGPEDAEAGRNIKAMAAGADVHNGCGHYSVNQSASLVRQADAVITHDTGMMHIAAAFRKKIVSVWGNTIPEFGMYPYYPHDRESQISDLTSQIVEIKGLRCRPCSKLGYKKCPKKHFHCMERIDELEIVEAVSK